MQLQWAVAACLPRRRDAMDELASVLPRVLVDSKIPMPQTHPKCLTRLRRTWSRALQSPKLRDLPLVAVHQPQLAIPQMAQPHGAMIMETNAPLTSRPWEALGHPWDLRMWDAWEFWGRVVWLTGDVGGSGGKPAVHLALWQRQRPMQPGLAWWQWPMQPGPCKWQEARRPRQPLEPSATKHTYTATA